MNGLMDLKLAGKRALVQGASKGIGRAIAAALAKEGARVAICARDPASLEATAKAIGAERFFSCDLSRAGQGRESAERARRELGGLDIVVVNGGGPPRGSFMEVSPELWHAQFQNVWM